MNSIKEQTTKKELRRAFTYVELLTLMQYLNYLYDNGIESLFAMSQLLVPITMLICLLMAVIANKYAKLR